MSYINNTEEVTPIMSVAAGAFSGLFVRCVIAPVDIIKIRLQLQITPSQYKSITRTIYDLYKNEGIAAFWKGNVPASLMYLAYGGSQFYTFTVLSNAISYSGKYTSLVNTGIGMCSGCVAMMVTYPLDLVRTRLASNSKHEFQSMTKTFSHIYHTNSFKGLFVGSYLSLCYVSLTTGISFGIYSKINNFNDYVNIDIKNIAGVSAGFLSKTIVYPLDLIKRRLQMNYSRTFMESFTYIIKNQGFFSLYRGLLPALLKSAPATGMSYFFYERFIEIFKLL